MTRLLFILFLLLRIPSCRQDKMNVIDYIQWVEDKNNGLKVCKSIEDIDFVLQYKPEEYIVLKQLRKPSMDQQTMENEKKEMGDMQYFTLSITAGNLQADILKYGLDNQQDYSDRLNYFSSEMQRDLVLVDGTDSLKCLLFHYERNYGLAPYSNFLLAFEKKIHAGKMTDKILVYNDRTLETGIAKLIINGASLDRIPELKLE